MKEPNLASKNIMSIDTLREKRELYVDRVHSYQLKNPEILAKLDRKL